MYSTSSLQGVWHHIHGWLHQICQCKVQFDQYVTTNIGVLFPYMVSLYNVVATSCNQSFYKSHQEGNSQLQSSCDQLRFSPVASPSEKLQLDFKTLLAPGVNPSTANLVLRIRLRRCALHALAQPRKVSKVLRGLCPDHAEHWSSVKGNKDKNKRPSLPRSQVSLVLAMMLAMMHPPEAACYHDVFSLKGHQTTLMLPNFYELR